MWARVMAQVEGVLYRGRSQGFSYHLLGRVALIPWVVSPCVFLPLMSLQVIHPSECLGAPWAPKNIPASVAPLFRMSLEF